MSAQLTQVRFATVRKVHPRGLSSTAGTWPDAAVEVFRTDCYPYETQAPRQNGRKSLVAHCDAAVTEAIYSFAAKLAMPRGIEDTGLMHYRRGKPIRAGAFQPPFMVHFSREKARTEMIRIHFDFGNPAA